MYYGNPYQDSVAAFENAYTAAKLGNVEMICQVGKFYSWGYSVKKDDKGKGAAASGPLASVVDGSGPYTGPGGAHQ